MSTTLHIPSEIERLESALAKARADFKRYLANPDGVDRETSIWYCKRIDSLRLRLDEITL